MNLRRNGMVSLAMGLAMIGFAHAGVATKEKPLAKLKVGEKTYTKVYVFEYQKETGKVILEHEWGSKGVLVEKLTEEQKKALGVKAFLTSKELAENRAKADKKHKKFVESETQKAAEATAKKKEAAAGKKSSVVKKGKIKYRKVVTKKRVG